MRLAPLALVALAFACRYPHADRHFGLDVDEDGVPAETDCDDEDPEIGASITFHTDADGDGVGVEDGPTAEGCTPPDGFAPGTDDCDDADDDRFPGHAEVADDGVDQDCNDADTITCYGDGDGDGWGSTTEILAPDGSCDTAQGEAGNDDDCADADDDRFPGADEIPGDGIDQNCDGSDTAPCYTDFDDDGFGDPLVPIATADCAGAGGVTNGDDCDDTRETVKPGAVEACEGLPSDCDDWTGPTSPGTRPASEVDDDDDGYVECSFADGVSGLNWGNVEAVAVIGDEDCADDHGTVFPGADEACDGFPSDCGDWTNPTTPGSRPDDEVDHDDDGFVECSFAAGVTAENWGNIELPNVTGGGDCDDDSVVTFPGASEICDGKVNACGGALPANEIDNDDDAWVECAFASGVNAGNWGNLESPAVAGGGDCDDAQVRTFPGGAEFCDGIDNDCDTSITDEDGRVSFQPTSGAWTDHTPAGGARSTIALASDGTLWFCRKPTGVYNVKVTVNAGNVSLIGRNGPSQTILSGADPANSNTPVDRIVHLLSTAPGTPTLVVRDLTLEDGNPASSGGGAIFLQKAADATIDGCDIRDSYAPTNGGGLYVTGGTATVTDTTFSFNEGADNGGAIWIEDGTLTMTGGSITDSDADHGAGVYAAATVDSMTFADVDFTGNYATNSGGFDGVVCRGGAINALGGTLTITGGTFDANEAESTATGASNRDALAHGGAVYFGGTTLTIQGATFTGNVADAIPTSGGDALGRGGAIYVASGTATIGTASEFSGNSADALGGAIHIAGATVTISGGTDIHDNSAAGGSGLGGGGVSMVNGSLTLTGSSVDDNAATVNDGGGIFVEDDDDATIASVTINGGSSVSGNSAGDWGGGIACHGECAIVATDSLISDNDAVEGAGVHLSDALASFSCVATTPSAGGVIANAATGTPGDVAGGAQIAASGATVSSTQCDWGVTGALNNTPADIGYDGARTSFDTSPFPSFTCTYSTGCVTTP